MIETTQEAEIKRVQENRRTWELFSSTSLVGTLHKARDLGWKEKKVQVRVEKLAQDMVSYIIEPFEKDCSCPNMLRYRDFFD